MFCLDYYPFKDHLKEVEQYKIHYKPADRTLEDFLKKYQNKSIIIVLDESFEQTDAKLFKGLSEKYTNFKLVVNFNNKKYFELIQQYELPFFFTNFVTTIDQLHGYLKYNPTDMYICEELGFSLDKISTILHNNNIKVRVIPNICQSSFPETNSLLTFFIRPEDLKYYFQFVDVFELLTDEARQAVIYKIYKQGYWAGPINQIIPSFKEEGLDGRFMMDYFGQIRSKCGKRCLYKPNSCNICYRFIDLSNVLKENKLFVPKKKNKEVKND